MATLFGTPKPPAAPPVTTMPDEQDPAVIAARKRQYQIASERSGRASTLLSDSYSKSNLGGGG